MKPIAYIVHIGDEASLAEQIQTCRLVTQAVAREEEFGELQIEIKSTLNEVPIEDDEWPDVIGAGLSGCDDPECPFCI